jgi:uncharacterized protein (TIGR02646 family)
MREIRKGHEPRELQEYRCKPDAVYDGPLFTSRSTPNKKSVKDIIRSQLLSEQGWLCAYCMKRIGDTEMKVEHWHCQDNYPLEQLDYRNLLAVCQGNEGQPEKKQTCDTCKLNRDLKYHPANPDHHIEGQIRFLSNGDIQSDDGEFDKQLDEILNLKKEGNPQLAKNRKAIWDAVHEQVSKQPGSRTLEEIDRLLSKWNMPTEKGLLQPYCAVAVYYLRKRRTKAKKLSLTR